MRLEHFCHWISIISWNIESSGGADCPSQSSRGAGTWTPLKIVSHFLTQFLSTFPSVFYLSTKPSRLFLCFSNFSMTVVSHGEWLWGWLIFPRTRFIFCPLTSASTGWSWHFQDLYLSAFNAETVDLNFVAPREMTLETEKVEGRGRVDAYIEN